MKAAQIKEYGGPEDFTLQETAVPEMKAGQVLVKVMAAAVNPFDLTLASGALKANLPLSLPLTLGGDLAGTVMAVGPDSKDLEIGMEIYGTANAANGGSGAMAEFAAVNAANLAPKPGSADWTSSASLPLAGTSALQAIEEHINLVAGQKILIQGGAGGIGSIAIQLAKLHGATVATTVRGEDREYVRSLGADTVIDYQTEKFEEKISGYDAVFDTVGGDVVIKSMEVLRRGGILVTMIGQPDPDMAEVKGIRVVRQQTIVNTERLAKLAQYIDAGQIKPQIDRIFGLAETKEAYLYFRDESPNGKVVVKIAA